MTKKSKKNSSGTGTTVQEALKPPVIKLILEPVKRESSQNRHEQTFNIFDPSTNQIKIGQRMHKNKATGANGIGCTDELVFKQDASRTRYRAGMQEQVPNPFKDLEPGDIISYYRLPKEWRPELEKIVDQDYISKQQELEIRAGVAPDAYTDAIPVGNKLSISKAFFDPDAPKTVLQDFTARIYDRTDVITNETPRGALMIQLLKNRPDKIAKSRDHINTATHIAYIAEEHEEFIISKAKNDRINEAIAELVILQRKHTPRNLWQIASMLTYHDNQVLISGEVPNLFVEQEMNDYIKLNRPHQLENIKKFMTVAKLLTSNKPLFNVKFLIQQALNLNVMSEQDGYIFWHSQKHAPERYKWSSKDKLESYIFTQMDQYNPEEKDMTNGYKDLIVELKSKNAPIGDL